MKISTAQFVFFFNFLHFTFLCGGGGYITLQSKRSKIDKSFMSSLKFYRPCRTWKNHGCSNPRSSSGWAALYSFRDEGLKRNIEKGQKRCQSQPRICYLDYIQGSHSFFCASMCNFTNTPLGLWELKPQKFIEDHAVVTMLRGCSVSLISKSRLKWKESTLL